LIPIRDENRSLTSPHVTRILIIINTVVFFVSLLPDLFGTNWLSVLLGNSQALEEAVLIYGMVPSQVLQGQQLYTLFTSMFLHADLLHLGGNMVFLYVFGDNVEDTFGHARYLAFYLLAGLAAGAAHVFAVFSSADAQAILIPTIGASGAISGVLGAYLVLYPRARILTIIFFGWIWITALPAAVFLGLWFVYQFLYGLLALETALSGIAYWAHVGGFAAGLFFGAVWRGRRRKREF